MKRAASALALVAAQVTFAVPAAGAVDDETVKALIERIEKQEARIAELEKAVERATGSSATAVSPPVPVAPAVAGPKIETKGGLKIVSADGKNSFSFGGRIQADAAQ